jgi:hypothetical protein
MLDDKKLDPFKPQQPHIPGVPETKAAPSTSPARTPAPVQPKPPTHASKQAADQPPALWAVFVLGGVLIVVIGVVWWSHASAMRRVAPAPIAAALSPTKGVVKPSEKLLVGPGLIATTDELARVWSAKRFIFRDSVTSDQVPAMVVHLPTGDYWGFSMREPYGSCGLEFVTDLGRLEAEYGYHASHPMVVDPCNKSVFDLMRYGSSPSGLVRGEIALGAAVRPPIAIQIEISGKQVRAVKMEE